MKKYLKTIASHVILAIHCFIKWQKFREALPKRMVIQMDSVTREKKQMLIWIAWFLACMKQTRWNLGVVLSRGKFWREHWTNFLFYISSPLSQQCYFNIKTSPAPQRDLLHLIAVFLMTSAAHLSHYLEDSLTTTSFLPRFSITNTSSFQSYMKDPHSIT